MKNLFVPLELMLKLEEKGFMEDCICGYNKGGRLVSKISIRSGEDCSWVWERYDDSETRAATWQQVVDWFREKHGIIIRNDFCVMSCTYNPLEKHFKFKLLKAKGNWIDNAMSEQHRNKSYNNYYEGLSFYIEQALTLIP